MFLHRGDTNTIYLQTVLPLSDLLFLSILPSQRTTSSLFYMNNRYIFHICILVSIHSSEGIMTKETWICYHCITSWFWLLDVHKWSGEAPWMEPWRGDTAAARVERGDTGYIENRVSDIFCNVFCLQTRNRWKCWLHQIFVIRHTERGKVLSIPKVKIEVPTNEMVQKKIFNNKCGVLLWSLTNKHVTGKQMTQFSYFLFSALLELRAAGTEN